MDSKIISLFFVFLGLNLHAQQFIGNNGIISFFSQAPLENISAINKKVVAAYDATTNDILFQLKIEHFNFHKTLMEEHFNENYLESDIYPNSTFTGKIIEKNNERVTVEGYLTIHGETNKIKVKGMLLENDNSIRINVDFVVKLADYKVKIPKIVTYKIAKEIEVIVDIELKEIE